jgi:prepilin-type N-terminal cleavage/methylation domain-containing protein
MMNKSNQNIIRRRLGFTLAEMLVVIVILGISSMVVIPLISGTTDMQATSAARQIVSTLLFAQTAAIAHQQQYQVVFDTANNVYEVQDASGTVIADPMSPGSVYRVDFAKSSGLSQVRLDTVTFNGENNVWFNRLGAPYCGDLGDNIAMTNGMVAVKAGEQTINVAVEPVGGRIKVN